MTRALDIRETQIRTIIRAAKKENWRVELKVGETTVVLSPDAPHDEERKPKIVKL